MSKFHPTDPYACQKCRREEWSPARSETCFQRTTVFLPWGDAISLALLATNTLFLSLLAGTAALFARHLQTPVVRSAGGWLSFSMLGALAVATLSLNCYFGAPGRLSCLVRLPLYNVSFSLCLACMVARSFQIVVIFKMATTVPRLGEAWRRHRGSWLLTAVLTGLQGLITAVSLSAGLPALHRNYDLFPEMVFLECKSSNSGLDVGGLVYNILLGLACFALSYLGKDLPSSYSEAKCITFSLLVYFVALTSYTITRRVYQGRYLVAMYVAFHLCSLSGIFGGYFGPKAYVILFHSERNTNEHFQMSIQSYTKRINTAG